MINATSIRYEVIEDVLSIYRQLYEYHMDEAEKIRPTGPYASPNYWAERRVAMTWYSAHKLLRQQVSESLTEGDEHFPIEDDALGMNGL